MITNNIRKLKSTAAPVSVEDEINVLARRVAELDERDSALTRQIVHLEKTTSSKLDRSGDVAAAEALLGGEKFDATRNRAPISELAALHAEREVVRRALKIGRRQRLMPARRRRRADPCQAAPRRARVGCEPRQQKT
jgi:hypothetical protein